MTDDFEIQPITHRRDHWEQCSERDATAWYVSCPRFREHDARFLTRSEAVTYLSNLRKAKP